MLTEEPATQAPQEGQEARGVLRNLLAGHYKGVADVRLRINFHEELTAMQAQATCQSAGGAAGELASAVNEAVAALAGEQTLTVEQQNAVADLGAAFDQAADDATGAYNDGSIDGAGLRSAIQSAFDALLAGLEPIFAPAPPTLDASPENTPLAAPAASPLDALRAACTEALDAALTPVSILPPLSAPSGNGKAYDKFLAIYAALQAPPPETPDPGVDVQA